MFLGQEDSREQGRGQGGREKERETGSCFEFSLEEDGIKHGLFAVGLGDLYRFLPTGTILFYVSREYLGHGIHASVPQGVESAAICFMCVSRCTLRTLSKSNLSAELDSCMNNLRILTKLRAE